MKIILILNGLTERSYLYEGVEEYRKRILHYIPLEVIEIQSPRNQASLPVSDIRQKERLAMERHIQKNDFVILLDEHGKEFRSVEFAAYLDRIFSHSARNLVFIVGGPFGFDEIIRKRADQVLSLSRMTFSHQMVRLFFLEQLYRALTILKGQAYHHE